MRSSHFPIRFCWWTLLSALLLTRPAFADSISSADDPAAAASYVEQEPILATPVLPDANNLSTELTLPELIEFQDPSAPPAKPAVRARQTAGDDLWQRIRDGYGMPNLQSPFTATHESWYAARPDYVQRMVDRGQRYLYHVVEEVQKRGMPTEIALLPMIESAFNPTAYSRSKASGIWQFVPATGKHYGLKQDWWKDNRRDVMAATDAALTYLQKLHVMFGTWELALAAYNAGEGTVQRAIERNRRMGLPTDYQSLQLPPETRNYVPKLQAVKNIVSSPEQYGLNIKPIENKPYFTSVPVPAKMDVHVAAKLAGVSVEEFKQLNPAYNRPVITSDAQSILLPIGTEDNFAANLANYNRPLVSWKTHYAKRGEKVSTIAKKYGVSVNQLIDVNDLSRKQRLRANQPLLVPAGATATIELPEAYAAAINETHDTPPVQEEKKSAQHTVKSGDTAYSIAKRYGMTTRQLMALNNLKSARLKKGQILAVAADSATGSTVEITREAKRNSKSGIGKTRYVVKRGETLSSIARKFNVATSDLQRWNKISGSRILPGVKLIIYKPDSA